MAKNSGGRVNAISLEGSDGNTMNPEVRRIKVGGMCGVLGVLLYLALALADPYIGPQTNTSQEFLAAWGTPKLVAVNMALHFSLAAGFMLLILGFIGLKHLLGSERQLVSVATILGIIACSVMGQMVIVQGSIMSKMSQTYAAALTDTERQLTVTLYRGLRSIDYGLDLAFDVFFFTAWILLAFSMIRHQNFGRVFGGIGLFLFLLAFVLNLHSAPNPPVFDVGPIAALWMLAVYIQMVRAAKGASQQISGGKDGTHKV